MTRLFLFFILLITPGSFSHIHAETFFDHKAREIGGNEVSFSKYKGKVVLVANTASKCGTTVQYKDLQSLYDDYKDRGFVVLAFPSGDFGDSEYNDNEKIHEFCKQKFGISFPIFEKNSVRGTEKHQIFNFLTDQANDDLSGEVTFNFEKFLIGRDGMLKGRFGPFTTPTSVRVREKIELLLNE